MTPRRGAVMLVIAIAIAAAIGCEVEVPLDRNLPPDASIDDACTWCNDAPESGSDGAILPPDANASTDGGSGSI